MDTNNVPESYNQMLAEAIEYLETLTPGSDEYFKQAKLINEMMSHSTDDKKIDSAYWTAKEKNENDLNINKEKLNAEKELAEARLVMEEESHKAEMAVKESEIKANKIRCWTDLGKGLATIGIFALFEVLAHRRDMADVIGNDPTHVSKNPVKLKFF